MLAAKFNKSVILMMLVLSFMTACHHNSAPIQEPDLLSVKMPEGIEYGYVVTDRHGEIVSEGKSPVVAPLQVQKGYNLYCYSPGYLQRDQIYIPVDLSVTADFRCGGVTVLGNNSRVTLNPQLSGLRILIPKGSSVESVVLKLTPSHSRFNLMSMSFENSDNIGNRKAKIHDNEAFFALFPSSESQKYILDVVHNDGRRETITLNLLAKAGDVYSTTLKINKTGKLELTGFIVVDWSVVEHSFEFAYEDIQ